MDLDVSLVENKYILLNIMINKSLLCTDCKNSPWDDGEDFYVKDALWESTIPKYKRNKVICIGCFEKRLGRILTQKDFKSWFLKNKWFGNSNKINESPSNRLKSRLNLS